MGTLVAQFCPLCRCSACLQDAVRTHLIADHKRSAAQADELIARRSDGRRRRRYHPGKSPSYRPIT
jgi:hypothetical protein